MLKALIVVAVVVLSCACAPQVWVKSGASEQDFYRDNSSCQAMGRSGGQVGEQDFAGTAAQVETYQGCMYGKGYKLERVK